MQFQLSSILSAILTFQLFFIAFFLLSSRKGKRLSNLLLGIFFLLVAINIGDLLMSLHGLQKYYYRLALLDGGFVLALGPLIYMYTKSVIYKNYSLSWSEIKHLAPFGLVTLVLIVLQATGTAKTQKQLIDDVQTFNLPAAINVVVFGFYMHAAVYLFFCQREVFRYREMIREEYSSIDEISLSWLNFIIRTLGAIIVVAVVHSFVPLTFLREYVTLTLLLFIAFVLYFISAVILRALKQPEVFSGIEDPRPRYAASPIAAEELEAAHKSIAALMENDKPFLDPELNITQLAHKLALQPKKLSQIINQSFGKSFFDFVNSYRIEEAKRLLSESTDGKLTVLEVLYECGFNSKSSFNTAFKKVTGATPSEFKRFQAGR